jgi:hypothetical protein
MDGARQVTTLGAYVISPGLYQINVAIPSAAAPGDHLLSCSYAGFFTNADKPTLIAVGPTTPPSGFIPGSWFQITGTLTLNNRPLSVQMTVQPQGFNLYSVTFDDQISANSGLTIDFNMLQTTPAISGNTFSITGPTSNSHYQDTTAGPQPVVSLSPIRANLYFDSFDQGSNVSGIFTFAFTSSAGGGLRGTFSGTVAWISKPAE